MSGYLTGTEIGLLWHMPETTVRWYAHRDRWRRTSDRRKPVLYLTEDVEHTMAARLDTLTCTNDPDRRVGAISPSANQQGF